MRRSMKHDAPRSKRRARHHSPGYRATAARRRRYYARHRADDRSSHGRKNPGDRRDHGKGNPGCRRDHGRLRHYSYAKPLRKSPKRGTPARSTKLWKQGKGYVGHIQRNIMLHRWEAASKWNLRLAIWLNKLFGRPKELP